MRLAFQMCVLANRKWGEKGSRDQPIEDDLPYQNRFTLIGAISDRHVVAFQLHRESCKTIGFVNFVQEVGLRLKELGYDLGKTVIWTDNCSTHQNERVKKHFKNRLLLDFLPPYSPALNAIEGCWSVWKASMRGFVTLSDKELVAKTVKTFTGLSQKTLSGHVSKTLRLLTPALNLDAEFNSHC